MRPSLCFPAANSSVPAGTPDIIDSQKLTLEKIMAEEMNVPAAQMMQHVFTLVSLSSLVP